MGLHHSSNSSNQKEWVLVDELPVDKSSIQDAVPLSANGHQYGDGHQYGSASLSASYGPSYAAIAIGAVTMGMAPLFSPFVVLYFWLNHGKCLSTLFFTTMFFLQVIALAALLTSDQSPLTEADQNVRKMLKEMEAERRSGKK